VASSTELHNFDASLGCLYAPALERLAAQLLEVDLAPNERQVVLGAVRETLCEALHAKLSRLLILELNAARVTGQLQGADKHARWQDFLRLSSRPDFWHGLSAKYPDLERRIRVLVENRRASALTFAGHFAADRAALDALVGVPLGTLRSLSFGAGDTHQGGKTVAIVECAHGRVVYKPRSLAIDSALARFVDWLVLRLPSPSTIRVPCALVRGSHGWAEFVAHRHAADDGELRGFYRGIGHWLAVMRLLAGNDLHAENLIAQGASPVIVDCETLFVPDRQARPTGLGEAFDRAASLISGSVLGVGLLPGRGIALGWRGVDSSGLGMLPGEQPKIPQPAILDAGTDEARIGLELVDAPLARNHPSPQPALARYWDEVLAGFDEVTAVLRAEDAAGTLEPELARFRSCQVRLVPRATEAYSELARMLWHPVSLHKQEPAVERAKGLLAKMAANVGSAPDDPLVIRAEVEDLLVGDIPFFTARADEGVYTGPAGTRWLPPSDLVQAALAAWRQADFALERGVIQASLVSAYINDGWTPGNTAMVPRRIHGDELDRRRRRQAARILEQAVATAIPGDDGSVAWIAPILEPQGWSVQPLGQDLYGGVPGLALLTAAYLREVAGERADAVAGVEELFARCRRTMELGADFRRRLARSDLKLRPHPPGGFLGIGSLIWVWLTLERWGLDAGAGLEQAREVAALLAPGVEADAVNDLLVGTAGTLVPLLQLAGRTGEERWLALASRFGDLVCARAQVEDGKARWPSEQWPAGLGGFAHGSTGIGWALSRLAAVSGSARHRETAEAAFAFERSLFVPEVGGWRDLRAENQEIVPTAWCHGTVGIGVALLDLDPELRRPETRESVQLATATACRIGLGWNHTLCHGDLGVWEVVDRAAQKGLVPPGVSPEGLLAHILSSLEEFSPICGLARDAFSPGLFAGVGGVAYQLLRAHPEHRLPSVMTLEEAAP
jgi:type 2 lantibiotic biosynthesis protein LanM